MSTTDLKDILIGLSIIIGIILLIGYPIALHLSEHQVQITVKEKWVKYHGNDAKYLVSDINNNVYSIEDSWWYLTFDASDRYAKITVNQTYTATAIGWRVQFLSWYSNLVKVE